jgi:mRNA interferase MazF
VKRGEVWTAAGGADYAGKPRPVAIIQNDRFDSTKSVTVCSLTSVVVDADILRLEVKPSSANGLKVVSYLMVDKITTIPRVKLGRPIGKLDDVDLARLNEAIVTFLALEN